MKDHIQKGDIRDEATLDVTDKAGEVEVSKVIVGVMRVNEDGELEPLGTWTGDVIFDGTATFNAAAIFNALATFNGGLCVPLGERLTFGACAGDDYITQAVDDELDFVVGGDIGLHLVHGGVVPRAYFPQQMQLREGASFILNAAEDSYFFMDGTRELHLFLGGGNPIVTITEPLFHIQGNLTVSGTYPTSPDAAAIHDNVANEITAVALKGAPVDADELIIEDSAAAYVKKSATLGSLPFLQMDDALIRGGDIESTDDVIVGDDLTLGIGQRINMDDDLDTYWYCDIDDRVFLIVGGSSYINFSGFMTQFYRRSVFGNDVLCANIATPAVLAGYSTFFGQDVRAVNHMHAMDEAGNVHDLTPDQITQTAAGPVDNLSVVGVSSILIDTNSNDVTIGGFAGGIAGQQLHIAVIDHGNKAKLEHEEGGATQAIHLKSMGDEELENFGGWDLICDGSDWYDCTNKL